MSSGFETLNLHPQLKKAIDALGFKQMTPIQQKVLNIHWQGTMHWSRKQEQVKQQHFWSV
jgi:superfamily II DNA/RNA helicase